MTGERRKVREMNGQGDKGGSEGRIEMDIEKKREEDVKAEIRGWTEEFIG